MPNYDYFTPVEQPNVLAQIGQLTQLQGVMDSKRKKAQLAQFLQTGDVNTVEGLRQAYQIDPDFGIKLSKMQGEQGAAKNKMAQMAAQTEKTQTETAGMKAKALAGIGGMTLKQFKSMPPEQQTPEKWAQLYTASRTAALQLPGFFTPEELPDMLPPQVLEAQLGGGFSPSAQAADERGRMGLQQNAQNQEQMMGLRERQFAQQTGIENQRLGIEGARLNLSKQSAGQEQAARVAAGQRADRSAANLQEYRGEKLKQSGGPSGKQNMQLRKEFNTLPVVKNYASIIPIVKSAREAVDVDTPSADMNLVYAAAKVMDPESVVRESETKMVVGVGSPAQQMLGTFDYVVGGGRLTPSTRKQLMNEIESRAKGHEDLYTTTLQQYKSGAPEIGGNLPKLGAGRNRPADPTGAGAAVPGSMQMAPAGPTTGAAPPPGAGGEHPQALFQRLMTGGQ